MGNIRLTLLHSNDFHGAFLPEEKDGKKWGGVSYLSSYLNDVRVEEDNVIYAIAGDLFRGSVIDSEFKGLATIEIMNYLRPDVVTVGNHEVDYGVGHLLFLEKCARFPIINANLFVKSSYSRLFVPYKIIKREGLNIMFIGVLTEEVLSQTKQEDIIGSFVDIKEARKEIGVIIDNYKTTKIDYTVLLTHIGFEQDKQLAMLFDKDDGIDLIIGGHSHTLLKEPVYVNNIPIVQAGMNTDHLGRFDLEFSDNDHKLVKSEYQLIDINEDNCHNDRLLDEIIDDYKEETDKKYQRIVGYFKRPLTHPSRIGESELGNLFADLMQEDSSFDIMLFASGSIRQKELGPVVTYQRLLECLPFIDPVYMLEVKGEQFRKMMLFMLRDEAFETGSHTEFYQVSRGLRMVYSKKNHEFREFKFNGQDIKDDDVLKIALHGYHYNNFSKFFNVDFAEVCLNKRPRKVINECISVIEEMLGDKYNVDSAVEGRIVIED